MMWSFLITVNSEIEADIIIGLLDEGRIPTRKKDPGGLKASYGISNGIEIWVPCESLEQAHDLLKTLLQDSESLFAEEAGDDFSSLNKSATKLSGGLLPRTIIVCFIVIIFVLIYGMLKE